MSANANVSATGTITEDYTATVTNGQTIYALASVSANNLVVNAGLTVPLSVTAEPTSGLADWFSPFIWSDEGILGIIDAGINVVTLISGVLDANPLALPAIGPAVNSLEHLGPTNRPLPISQLLTVSYGGVSFSVGASVTVAYDVTIGAGADVDMDQSNVVVNSLTVAAGGSLYAGLDGFTIDTQLVNAGSLWIESGVGGTVQGAFNNSGYLVIGGALTLQGPISNSGTLIVGVGATFDDAEPTTNDGTIIASGTLDVSDSVNNTGGTVEASNGGTLDLYATLDNSGGVVAALSGGTVDVYSTLSGGVLSGGGVFQAAGGHAVLQDVTLAADATFTALESNYTTLSGSIDNAGTLLASTGAFVANGTVTLSGGGQVVFTSGGGVLALSNFGLSGTSELVNADNTITGGGAVFATIDNQSGGVVDANASGQALQIDATVSNGGTVEASNGGTLFLATTLDNGGGVVAALSGGTVDVYYTLSGGVLSGGGVFQAAGGHAVLQDVTLAADATFTALESNYTTLSGSIDNAGTLLASTGAFVANGTVTLSGGGQVVFTSGGGVLALSNFGLSGTSELVNADNTITGGGAVFATIDNQSGGVVDANASGQALQIDATVSNGGTVEASNGGTLFLATTLDNGGGVVAALSGGTVDVYSTLSGGVLSGGGVFQAAGGHAVLQDVTLAADATFTALESNYTTLSGSIDNAGTLLASTGAFVANGTVTLSGGGQVVFTSGGGVLALSNFGLSGTSELVNADNTITGGGAVFATIDNQSGGVVDANASGQALQIDATVSNGGTVEASNGGTLFLATTLDNGGGVVAALSGGTVDVYYTLSGGVLSGGGVFQAAGGHAVLQDVTLAADATFTALESNYTTLSGSIDNAGTLLASTGAFVANGTVTLSGGGQVVFTSGGGVLALSNFGLSGTSELVNADNTITGGGAVFATIDNQSGGVVDANASGQALQIDATVSNGGTVEASNGGTLFLATTLDNGGGVVAALSGGTVDVYYTLSGGVLSGGGVFQAPWVDYGSAVLQDVTLAADATFTATAGAGNPITLSGSIDNAGTLAGNGQFVANGTVTLSGGGQVVLTGGGINPAAASGSELVNADNTITGGGYVAATIDNQSGGVVDANASGQALQIDATVSNGGTIEASKGGTLDISTPLDNSGGTIQALSGGQIILGGSVTGAGTLRVGSAGTLEIAGAVSGGNAVLFVGAGTLQLDAAATFAAPISGFAAGDTIALTGIADATTATLLPGNTLQITQSTGAPIDLQLDPTQNFAGATFSVATIGPNAAITDATACFATGTSIATDRGETPVEHLRIGDRVIARGLGAAPISWLGHRRIDCRRHPRPHEVWPVRITAGAFAANTPERDLLLSPDHAVAIDGVLIPIRYLLNGATIAQEPCDRVTYWHVELPRHDILLAEGLACESYLDTGNRAAFDNSGGAVMLHADFARKIWATEACARLVTGGADLAAAHAKLLARASVLGHRTTDDPALRLRAAGRLVPAAIDGATYRFPLPPAARRLRLLSRSAVPAEMSPDRRDHRRLGIAVGRVALDGMPLALADPRLGAGWHRVEDGFRWTDGDAAIERGDARTLEIRVAITGRYWLPGATWAPISDAHPAPGGAAGCDAIISPAVCSRSGSTSG